MKICKNCSAEFEGKYCNHCGQKFIERHSARTLVKDFTDSFDFNSRLFETLKGIFLTPRRLIDEYYQGISNKYIAPVTMTFIVVSLAYLLSESNVLGFSVITSQNELQYFFKNVRASLLAGLISGLLPFTAYNWIKYLFMSLYFISGLLILVLLADIFAGLIWIYGFSGVISQILMLLTLAYMLYFIFSVFKGHYRSLVIFILLFVSIEEFYDDAEYYIMSLFEINTLRESHVVDDLFFEGDLPQWSYLKIVDSNEGHYEKNLMGDLSYSKNDFDNDGIRDVTTFLSDSLGEGYLIYVNIKDDEAHTISLKDLFDSDKGVHPALVSPFNESSGTFTVMCTDSTAYDIYWKDDQIYARKSR